MAFDDEPGNPIADANESVDPLLQVTLPMVLFLAFVVVTEVSSLRQTERRYREEFSSPEGKLIEARDEAIIEIQRQLLLESARKAADDVERALDINAYRRAMPQPADIVGGRLSDDFRSASARIDTSIGAGARSATLKSMESLMLREFDEAATELVTRLGDTYAKVLVTKRDDPNRREARAQLEGRLAAMVDAARSIQLTLVLSWQEAAEVDQYVEDRPKSIWERLQRVNGDAETEAKRFVNLEVEALHERLDAFRVPLLAEVWRDAL